MINSTGEITWLDDDRLYYTKLDSRGWGTQIYLVDVVTRKEVLIFQELEENSQCRIWRSRSGRYLGGVRF